MQVLRGDIVLVDSGVFTASPERGKGTRKCEVLFGSSSSYSGAQAYVRPLDPPGSPMYVWNHDIVKLIEQPEETKGGG